MFVRKKEPGAEDKLLRIIEGPRLGAGRKTGKKLFKRKGQGRKISLNDFQIPTLLLAAVIATATFVFVLAGPRKTVKDAKERMLEALTKEEEVGLQEYANLVAEKNPFRVNPAEKKVEEEIVAEPEVQLKLVGILSGGTKYAQAFIEVEGKTYTCSQGDEVLNGIHVEKINVDEVILKNKGKEIKLK